MSIGLTRILQQITGLNTLFAGANAGRMQGVVLEDTATVTWGTDGFGNIQATASSAAPTGAENLVYATPAASSGPAALRALVAADLPAGVAGMQLIQTITPADNSTNSVTFSSIPQTFKHLLVLGMAEAQNGGQPGPLEFLINGDGGYAYINFNTSNTNGGNTVVNTASQNVQVPTAYTAPGFNGIAGASGGASPGAFEALLPNYTQNGGSKACTSTGCGGGSGTNCFTMQGGFMYNPGGGGAAPITSLVIVNPNGNYTGASSISLYGIEG